jgi:plasmid stability protein
MSMATITVKDIPDDLYAALKAAAAANRRSINREIIHSIETAVRSRPATTEELIDSARRLRARIGPLPVDEESLAAAKRQGRA